MNYDFVYQFAGCFSFYEYVEFRVCCLCSGPILCWNYFMFQWLYFIYLPRMHVLLVIYRVMLTVP